MGNQCVLSFAKPIICYLIWALLIDLLIWINTFTCLDFIINIFLQNAVINENNGEFQI